MYRTVDAAIFPGTLIFTYIHTFIIKPLVKVRGGKKGIERRGLGGGYEA